ncbi:MAG: hypothetical protein ACKO8W_17665, partial [Dolichospermum sp.]
MVREQGTGNRLQVTGYREQGTGYRVQGTGYTGRKTESCMATRRKLSKIKYYSYIDEANYPLPITNYP